MGAICIVVVVVPWLRPVCWQTNVMRSKRAGLLHHPILGRCGRWWGGTAGGLTAMYTVLRFFLFPIFFFIYLAHSCYEHSLAFLFRYSPPSYRVSLPSFLFRLGPCTAPSYSRSTFMFPFPSWSVHHNPSYLTRCLCT